MKRALFLTIICFIVNILSGHAQNMTVGDPDALNAVTVTSTKKLNMRLGPTSSAGIAHQFEPGEILWVTDVRTYDKGWVQVTDGTYIGFVSTEFIEGRNGDYYYFVANPQAENRENRESRFFDMPDWLPGLLPGVFMAFFTLPLWAILLICAILITAEIFAIRMLKDKYYFYRSPGTLYLFIIPTFIITAGIILMAQYAASFGREGSMVWFLMLACVLPLLVHSCWRLEQNGKIQNRMYRSNCKDAAIGKTIGIIVWLFVTLPMARSLYNITDELLRNTIGIPDRFWPMLLTMIGITAINYGIITAWFIIIDTCLKTLANFSVMLLSTCLFFIIIMAELDILNDFNGFLYVLSLILMLTSIGLFLGFYKALRQRRCARCHNFAGDLSGVTDRGYSTSSSDSWHDISDSSIRSSNIVRNARELRRTYTTMHNWTNHYQCQYCSNTWSMDESEAVHSETHALKRRWDEYS